MHILEKKMNLAQLDPIERDLSQYEWDFVDPPPKDCICPLCEKVLRKPMLTECCGSHFCEKCIQPLLGWTYKCASCNKEEFVSILNKQKWRKILELDVKCPLMHRGCLWTGELGERAAHLDPNNGDCEFTDTKCTYGCDELLEKNELEEHLEIFCPKRPSNCSYCNETGEYQIIIGSHRDRCPDFPVQCPNNCGVGDIKQRKFDQHLLNCPEQVIKCELSYAGCTKQFQRKNVVRHLQENSLKHIVFLDQFFSNELEKKDEELQRLAIDRDKQFEKLSEAHSQELADLNKDREKQMKALTDEKNRELKQNAEERDQRIDQIDRNWKSKYKQLQLNIDKLAALHWEIDRNDLDFLKIIQQGQNEREIWEGNYKEKQVAIKTLTPGASSSSFLQEVHILMSLQHKNIIQLCGVCTKSEPIHIVLEFMPNGTLLNYLQKNVSTIEMSEQVSFAASVASGLAYLEQMSCSHQRVGARNILVGNDQVCKIGGFSSAVMLSGPSDEYTLQQGEKIPIKWCAPEVLIDNKSSLKSDVWSFGILLYEVMTYGRVPYPTCTNMEATKKIKNGDVMKMPSRCPQRLYDIMLYCWKRDRQTRPTFDTLADQLNDLLVQDLNGYELVA